MGEERGSSFEQLSYEEVFPFALTELTYRALYNMLMTHVLGVALERSLGQAKQRLP